ncbi:MAG: ATPase, P-type (transporting), superfamily, subfamily [Acidimicrobiales bacterium]|nr:ATPase, P-type (transporting), superfamily, subfamily [Acidimicrobiales bacterium]
MPDADHEMVLTGAGGLSAPEVAARVASGHVNEVDDRTSRTVGEIIRANVLTRFNAILSVLAVAVLATGRWGDAAFAIVLVLNSIIGIGQELRAKRTLDKLALLHAPTARVVRDGETMELPVAEVVLDDLIALRMGDQVPADGEIHASEGLEVDESQLTGESDAMAKELGDRVLSGTIVVAGRGRFQARAVGADAYARKIAAEAKVFVRTKSEIEAAIDTLLRYITWVIIGVTPLLVWSQFRTNDTGDWREPVSGTVAALVGMVPEGLVLLTSVAFLLAALALTRRQVLVQELPAVEGLARVDVVCLDKTGTLTLGDIVFDALESVGPAGDTPGTGPPHDEASVGAALGAMADAPDPNASLAALGAAFAAPGWDRSGEVAFSSARKWSAASFDGQGTWYLGAPDVLLDADDPLRDRVSELAATGRRVLLVQYTDSPLTGEALPAGRKSVALCTLAEQVRPDAAETLRYFADQGVAIKVISGDNPTTVSAVATEVGIDVGTAIDARTLGSEPEDLVEAVTNHTVFGRVSPHQKRSMVRALQSQGHTVAMTGDGVNDALALKDADIGVAMGNGAQATRAVAQLVLLDGQFSRLPSVLGEGRRVIGNIERVASLFLSKNVYALMLVLLVSIAGLPFPFLPRHLTLISSVTIGIPAFVLALGPNTERYRPGFLQRVLAFAIPAGAITGIAIFVAYLAARTQHLLASERKTAATIAALVVALWVLVVLSRPFRPWKLALLVSMAAIASAAIAIPPIQDVFKLSMPASFLPIALGIGAAGAVGVEMVGRWADHRTGRRPRRPLRIGVRA